MFSPINDIDANFIAPGGVMSFEPVRTNHFMMFFPNIPKGTSDAPMSSEINQITKGMLGKEQGMLFTRCILKGADPEWSIETAAVSYFDEATTFPISHDKGKTFQVTLYDYADQYVSDSMWEWANNIFVVTPFKSRSTSGTPDKLRFKSAYHYKTDVELRVYANNGVWLRTFIYKNAYPTLIKFGTFDYSQAEANKLDVTFNYDQMDYSSQQLLT